MTARLVALAVALVALPGCAAPALYSRAGDSFAQGHRAAQSILASDFENTVRTRRMLAAMEYINRGADDANLNPQNVDASFGRFVCVGTGEYRNEAAALALLGAYGRVVGDLSRQPPDEVAALWRSIRMLQQPGAPLQVRPGAVPSYDECVSRIRPLVPPQGKPIRDASADRFAAGLLPAVETIEKLMAGLRKAFVVALRPFEEAARAEALRNFVRDNETNVNEVFEKLTTKQVTDMQELRLRASLVVPYLEFKEMMTLDRDADAAAFAAAANRVHQSLAEFDALRHRPDHTHVLSAMKEAHGELERLASGGLTPAEATITIAGYARLLLDLELAIETSQRDWEKAATRLSDAYRPPRPHPPVAPPRAPAATAPAAATTATTAPAAQPRPQR
jgi:hypothetical protein